MTHVVLENCIQCKYTDCVEVCPVDCFHEGPNFLAIDPNECIDCTLCVPECPVDAIVHEDKAPEDQQIFTPVNATLSRCWPVITHKKPALPYAERWDGRLDKRKFLDLCGVCDASLPAGFADYSGRDQ